jgi:hypothetical protein
MLLRNGREHPVPVRPAEVGRCAEGGDGVFFRADVLDLENEENEEFKCK